MPELTDSQQTDLNLLRTAADQRAWTTLQDTLKRLLATLDPLIALQVGATRLQAFLPTFETYYPEAGWVKELMLTVVSYASAPSELPESAVNAFPSPGCGNFVKGVLDLARAVQDEYTVFERYSHITNVVANSILAELQHLHFEKRTAEFSFIIDLDGDPQKKAKIQQKFWIDESVAERDTALWHKVADDVETRIKQG